MVSASIKINPSEKVTAILSGRLVAQKKVNNHQQPPVVAIPNPDKLIPQNGFYLGFHSNEITTTVYHYKDDLTFDFTKDTGCIATSEEAIDSHVFGDKMVVFTVLACDIGGTTSLRYMITQPGNWGQHQTGSLRTNVIAD